MLLKNFLKELHMSENQYISLQYGRLDPSCYKHKNNIPIKFLDKEVKFIWFIGNAIFIHLYDLE